jgi:hypothetical protein
MNSQRCNGNILEVCNSAHQWLTQQICAQTCDSSGATPQCSSTVACSPSSRRCTGNLVQVCNSTGSAWLTVQSCAASCTLGLCTGQCTPAEKRCDGNLPEVCDTSGTQWTASAACAGTCFKGACAEAGLTVDADANAVLEGEHVYDGDVVLKNSAVLTSTTGKLIIRANTVTLDATSKIVIAPTGDDPRGRGQDGTASTYCSSTGYNYTIAASGAGYGTSGETKSSCSTYSGTCYCSVSRTGGSVYAIADEELATGSAGGKCDTALGGKGGGYLAIYANTIVVQGQITALGAPGTSCAGGGSGGEVILRANSVTFTGSISTAGAAGGTSGGKGGDGVVKLLYGNSNTLTGTVTGSKFSSFMPPYDVSSSTHPRQDRWYNDGFQTFDLAWSKPFTNTAGYYDKLNTTYGFVPAPATSDFLSLESTSYLPASLTVNSTNYFHTATMGPFANVGTVESRYVLKVNGSPPTISSSSHPSSTTWYSNGSPYLSWVLPSTGGSPIPDDNVAGFYWVWDHFAETIPTAADNFIPMDPVTPQNSKQLLLPGNANGIWFFHLIAKDTMGYLTKTGASFRVQIGTAPASLGSVSGVISNANTSAFVSGATISLNRGVFTGTSTSTGTFSIQNVIPGSYEIRVRATGFTDSTSNVIVTGGQTSTVNFTLAPSP